MNPVSATLLFLFERKFWFVSLLGGLISTLITAVIYRDFIFQSDGLGFTAYIAFIVFAIVNSAMSFVMGRNLLLVILFSIIYGLSAVYLWIMAWWSACGDEGCRNTIDNFIFASFGSLPLFGIAAFVSWFFRPRNSEQNSFISS